MHVHQTNRFMQTSSLLLHHTSPINALVVGATGGIGLALCQALASNAQVARLFMAARNASADGRLTALVAEYPHRLVLHDCDIGDEHSMAGLAATILSQVPALHLTINASGLLHGSGFQPEKALAQVTLESLQANFAINTFAPVLLAKALMPLLRGPQPTVFASLSARVGSIGDNRLGGWYSYRAAKAAQNQLLKTLAIELTRVNAQSIVLALHPGTTDTALSKPFQSNVPPSKLFTPAFAAKALLKVIGARRPEESGGFYAWDGSTIDW